MRAFPFCIAAILIAARAFAAPADYDAKLKPLLTNYCYECHGDGASLGEFDMGSFKSAADLVKAKTRWEKAISLARAHVMPPPDAEKHPSQDERDQLVAAIQRVIYNIDPARPDPGRVTIRRLNATEYRNTVRDLIG